MRGDQRGRGVAVDPIPFRRSRYSPRPTLATERPGSGRGVPFLDAFHRIIRVIVIPEYCTRTKWVGPRTLERVPIANGKAEVFGHRFAKNFLFGIVMLKRQIVLRIRTFKFNLFYLWEKLVH